MTTGICRVATLARPFSRDEVHCREREATGARERCRVDGRCLYGRQGVREGAFDWILANVALLAHLSRFSDLAKLLALAKDAVEARAASLASSERMNASLAVFEHTSPCGAPSPPSSQKRLAGGCWAKSKRRPPMPQHRAYSFDTCIA
ncbi:hypothetical protein KC359_g34 [Hortaea werneckii]|nr:hypothetical protein KC359_g34 [Hortaea werneckii]